ncbi:hypothetical protein BaRGS_00014916, partial [Batillaria attramentaria]
PLGNPVIQLSHNVGERNSLGVFRPRCGCHLVSPITAISSTDNESGGNGNCPPSAHFRLPLSRQNFMR